MIVKIQIRIQTIKYDTELLKYFPKNSTIVQNTLKQLQNSWLLKRYKYNLSFIIKQYTQISKYYQPSLMDKIALRYRRNRKIHIHIIDARNEQQVTRIMSDDCYDVEWIYERLIWIGYYKNDQNQHCFLKNVPKVLLLLILSFLKTRFSIWKCINYDQMQKCGKI